MMIVEKIWILLVLAFFAWEDVRTHQLSAWALGCFLIPGMGKLVWRMSNSGILECTSMGGGLFLGLMSLLSGGGLGLGDALLVLELGMYIKGEEVLLFLTLAMLLGMVFAGCLFLKRKNGKEAFPLVPFFLASYVGGLMLWNG